MLFSKNTGINKKYIYWQKEFEIFLKKTKLEIYDDYLIYVTEKKPLNDFLIIEVAKVLDLFLREIFSIDAFSDTKITKLMYEIKRNFVQRRALKKYKESDFETYEPKKNLSDKEFIFQYLHVNENNKGNDDELLKYAAWATLTKKGKKLHKDSMLFKFPEKIDLFKLIDVENIEKRGRSGFELTDTGMNVNESRMESSYCILCHKKDKDSCKKGLNDKKNEIITNELNNKLSGCPLNQKISQMHELHIDGFDIGALGVICIDNPLAALTGYRICNECEKSCIYQKQKPVNTPAVETCILKYVLKFDFGFEIYSLLTRWNPIDSVQVVPNEKIGKEIAVVGQGPSGIACAHSLCRLGFNVKAIDALPIPDISSIWENPIKDVFDYVKNIDTEGFGGVSNYGITARWDKNFLSIAFLIIKRWDKRCDISGNIRLGTSIKTKDILKTCSHIVLALGAGQPNTIKIHGEFLKQIRFASDFLMQINIQKPYKNEKATLLVRLPIIVVGAGLTAVDTATEALMYYEKMAINSFKKWQKLNEVEKLNIQNNLTKCEFEKFQIVLENGNKLNNEKDLLKRREILNKLGGSSILYRKLMTDSPSYRKNHFELKKAMEEGINFYENICPKSFEKDKDGYVTGIRVIKNGVEEIINAGSVFIACGTTPYEGVLYDEKNLEIKNKKLSKDNFSIDKNIHVVGDLHPNYSGSVVNAIASGMKLAKKIYEIELKDGNKYTEFFDISNNSKINNIEKINDIYKVEIKSPNSSNNYVPGMQYRAILKNSFNKKPIALSVYSVISDIITVFVYPVGPTTKDLCKIKIGDSINIMPSGEGFPKHENESIVIISKGIYSVEGSSFKRYLQETGNFVTYISLFDDNKLMKYIDIKSNRNILIKSIEDISNYVFENKSKFYLFGNCDFQTNIFKIIKEKNKVDDNLIYARLFVPMQCMMKGV